MVGNSTAESLAATARRFSTSTIELAGNDIPEISIQEMEDTSNVPAELHGGWLPFEMTREDRLDDILAEYSRPRDEWQD